MKSTSIKNMTLLLSLTACFIQASESLNQKTWLSQAMDSIGQSSFIHAYSKHVQTKIDGALHTALNYGDEPASQKYQELGLEAQHALGTPQQHHLPIKKVNPNSSMAKLIHGMAESNAIYVGEENFAKMPYGAHRSAIFHESVHAKYHDAAMYGMLKQAGLWGGTIGTYAALKALNIVAWRKRLSVGVGIALAKNFSDAYSQFMERRADTQGHYGTQCSNCIYESMQSKKECCEELKETIKNSNELLPKAFKVFQNTTIFNDLDKGLGISKGYLSFTELAKIAQDLGDKKCAYHNEQK